MEDVLNLDHEPDDPQWPAVCADESTKDLGRVTKLSRVAPTTPW